MSNYLRSVSMSRSKWITFAGIGLVAALLYNLLSNPSDAQFETRFEVVTSYRNSNNTGPIKRIYLVTASQSDHAEMQAYGDLKPHSKYGTTTVYFFPEGTSLPSSISSATFSLSSELASQCLARYRKLAMRDERYEKGPLDPAQ